MTNPSWRQLAAIPESKLKAQILNACGIDPEVAGVCHIFHAGDIQIYASVSPGLNEKVWFTLYPAPGSRSFESPKELLKALRWPQGTPTGDALRKWLGFYGWKPKQ
jgi:hypothetical protein